MPFQLTVIINLITVSIIQFDCAPDVEQLINRYDLVSSP